MILDLSLLFLLPVLMGYSLVGELYHDSRVFIDKTDY